MTKTDKKEASNLEHIGLGVLIVWLVVVGGLGGWALVSLAAGLWSMF